MFYLYDPLADTCDEPHDNHLEHQQQQDFLALLFPWLSGTERSFSKLGEDPRFPGAFAPVDQLRSYATQRARGAHRKVDCCLNLGNVRVSARLDLVSGQVYLMNDGKWAQFEQTTVAHVEFPAAPTALLAFAQLVHGRINNLSGTEVLRVTEALAEANALPALA